MSKIFIGIDPGNSGSLAAIYHDGAVIIHEFKDATLKDLYDYFDDVTIGGEPIALLEKVHAMPGQGVSSMFTFGQNFGRIEMALTSNKISFTMATPQEWMKFYGVKREKEESKTLWKKRLRQLAEGIFPNIKVTANNADALLIANYLKQTHK
jgi:crossover junction endodeoxyribonuclease RuvC